MRGGSGSPVMADMVSMERGGGLGEKARGVSNLGSIKRGNIKFQVQVFLPPPHVNNEHSLSDK